MKLAKIGISSDQTFSSDKHFEGYKYVRVSNCFIEAVVGEGGIPYVLPIYESEDYKTILYEQIKNLDGIILSGGQDINPRLWGEEPLPTLGNMNQVRDAFELNLIKIATELNKPILGICRGAQLLNVCFGGTLYQDIFSTDEKRLGHRQTSQFDEVIHKVKIDSSSITSKIFGKEIWVNSYHHLAVKKLANRFKCTGKASDGIIEMFENADSSDSFIVGVQWHPEMLYKKCPKMKALFTLFLDICKK